jgi:alpha-methylacyl-CoA racemase
VSAQEHGPLVGLLVADLSWYLPGPFASRELLRLWARVVRLEPPAGDPMRVLAPGWFELLNAGKESVVSDLKQDPALGRALCATADVILEGFRPGVAERLGVGPGDLPDTVVYCSLTGFGAEGRHAKRAGHDVNYLGWAGALWDTAPAVPPVQAADVAAGGLAAVTEILAALYERTRTGRGRHIVVSMTHGVHRFVAHRLGGDPMPRLLTGGLASYGIYPTADGRHVTLGALEERFFARACELLGRPELASRQYDTTAQDELAVALAAAFGARPLAEWLEVFDGEDVCVGPVATLEEAAAEFGEPVPRDPAPALGEHTEAWRLELLGRQSEG